MPNGGVADLRPCENALLLQRLTVLPEQARRSQHRARGLASTCTVCPFTIGTLLATERLVCLDPLLAFQQVDCSQRRIRARDGDAATKAKLFATNNVVSVSQ